MEAMLLQPSPDRTISACSGRSRSNVFICCPAPSNSNRKRYGPFQTCNGPDALLNSSFFHRPVFSSQKPPCLPSTAFHSQKPPLLPLPVNTSFSNLQKSNANLHQRNFRGVNDQNRPSLPPRDRGILCPQISRKCKKRDRDLNLKTVNPKEVQLSEKFSNIKQVETQKKPSTTPLKADSGNFPVSLPRSPTSKQSDKDISISNAEHDLIDSRPKCMTVASTNPSGPDPSDLPTEVSGILRSVSSVVPVTEEFVCVGSLQIPKEKWFGSLYTVSPPPSSVPLPRFSLKQKVDCSNDIAGGIDAGATDKLRRLLKIN